MTATFAGFPIAALDFYEDLQADNTRSWWTEHKQTYDEAVRAPMVALLAQLEPEFGPGTVFRPYRDVRFAKDKSPYKTHQGGFVELAPGIGYYVQVDASGLLVGAGYHSHSSDQVARYRAAVDDDRRGGALQRSVDELRSSGFEIHGDRLKTQPRGFAADHPRIELLRHRSLTAGLQLGAPDWLDSAQCGDEVRGAWRRMTPLVEWLTVEVGGEHQPR